jgi:antitoxin MazE
MEISMQDGQVKETTAEVVKVGDELVVRLPAGAAERLALKEGAQVQVRTAVREEESAADRERRIAALIALRKYRGMRPTDFKFDRDEANARGRDDEN